MNPDQELLTEVERLRYVEAMRDLLTGENARLQRELNAEREKNSHLRDSLEGMISDMSLMETLIAELRGEEPF